MELLQPIADLLGLSPVIIVVAMVLIVVLVVAWFIVKTMIKISMKMFATGCAVLFVLVMGGAIFLALLQMG